MIIFWHRRDLRINDNIGLTKAYTRDKKVIGVFCLDPNILNRDDIAPARVKYLLGCLEALKTKYQKLGSDLLIFHNTPEEIIPSLAKKLKADAVYWNLDVEPFSRHRDKNVSQALKEKSIETQTFWDQLLHSPGEILSKSNQTAYTVYTPFWRNWEAQPKSSPVDSPQQLTGLNDLEKTIVKELGTINIPSLNDLGFPWDADLPLSPGEESALERLEYFCQSLIYNYECDRNYPFLDGTSQLSAALKFGAISVRTIWKKSQAELTNCNSDEARENIIAWQKEVAWREFYQHCLYFFPQLAEGAYREQFKQFPWENDEKKFQAWCEGKTGYPIVDAAMRQLNETGWMHNRCRMIVASFLTKDLIIDWRWGEKYFMQKLYDGDLAANNGGWQWSASSGMDPKPLRIFNPASQAQKFDPEAEYIRTWLPEIRHLDTKDLVTGKISPLEASSCGYPLPIVDHSQQQREFKRLYQLVKG
ncbi:FAD-binding domain-containing protein [Cyanobacterium aponinum UTEX 3221]|uniref:FAD-binding domain-containing protein n=1 Tax=Cyanobacterium aponinum TaxID=379064 RepID=UPI002B4C20BA|nr:FAD-binding domain-containing protein [Cyanobacterium aponinum]WRL37284.1 FAD-binding domain-containing protein [Cyanobacterium aponinum UTEX 3221]